MTRGLVKRVRNNGKDAEEGKYFEKELSSLERSYSPTTVEEDENADGDADGEMAPFINVDLDGRISGQK